MPCGKNWLKDGNISKNISNMKKTNYILIILFLFLVSCYPYYMETNKNGISKFKSGFTFIYLNLPKGSYAADEKFVRGVDLIFLHDII